MFSGTTFESALQGIRNSVDKGRLAQAYLVVGDMRHAAPDFAAAVLRLILCADRGCGVCRACRQIAGRTHPDVHWLEPQKKSRTIPILAIRDLQKQVYQTSFLGGWKAVVIAGADRLGTAGQDASGNAFLKTLEEPPPRTLMLLLTDTPDAVMATIRSRCQRVMLGIDEMQFDYPWKDDLLRLLKVEMAAGSLWLGMKRTGLLAGILAAIRGRIEKEEQAAAKAIEEQGGSESDDEELDARVESRYRGERDAMLRIILAWYRDIFVVRTGGGRDVLHFPDEAQLIVQRAGKLTFREALEHVRVIEELQRQLGRIARADDTVFATGMARLKV